MALSYRIFCRNIFCISNITKPVKLNITQNHSLRLLAHGKYQNITLISSLKGVTPVRYVSVSHIKYTTQNDDNKPAQDTAQKKPGLIQRFKQMYRDYWYVLVPVHMATSAVWFGSCYYAVRSGVDVLGMLESWGVKESLIAPLRDSSAGYFALAFALYKMATPLRYAVTVGGTTFAINKLTAMGWIRPVPSRERIKEMFQERKDNLQDRFNESKQHYQSQMKEKRNHVMDEMRRYKTEIRNMKNKVKKM